ncbi:acyl-CoA thioesterase/BAAT N-terminal domain-containing protein, partial [Desulfovibrio sp. OttesenSCG-928-O18]|nr:acyl-CoA thioesterase/BAAT N-terminal domain-containing protein [Desulfovibrio sp. OttesenSCG-928-O18]
MSGLATGPARLVTTMEKTDGSYWCSVALFDVGAAGTLDLALDAPVSGDWRIADPMAPVWSMRQVRKASQPEKSAGVDPILVQCSLTDASGTTHRGEFIQRFLAPGATFEPIAHPELAGTVFYPATPGPHPVVFGLNGSNGGMPLQRCALYAANGYIAVALAFFGAPGRPQYFGETPLEYFESALCWAKETLKPKNDFIAVAGSSRGGELAFILASTFPEHIHAVVAFVPSAVVNGIQQAGKPGLPRDTPAWYYKGSPLPNLWQGNPDADVSAYTTPPAPGLPIRQDGAFVQAMRNREFLEKARIPVERVNGPVIMVSAEDDGCWPSQLFSEMIEERLKEFDHPWPVEHVRNPRAGHFMMFPYIPVSEIVVTHPVSGLVMDFGGNVPVNAAACRDSWAKVMEFMKKAPDIYIRGTRTLPNR